MLGAIIGDVVGSAHERGRSRETVKTATFELFPPACKFTDDSVLTIATMQCMLTGMDYASAYRLFAQKYPDAGFGSGFRDWFNNPTAGPYNSFGNGSAMRVSPIGWISDNADEVLAEAKKSAEVSHNHEEGIKGAQAVALAVMRARTGTSKNDIRSETAVRFGYDMFRTCDDIRPGYRFEVSCQKSVPEAIIAFLDSTDFESAVRLAVSLGGDTDTQACMAGAIAEAFYGTSSIPNAMMQGAYGKLTPELADIVEAWYGRYMPHRLGNVANT